MIVNNLNKGQQSFAASENGSAFSYIDAASPLDYLNSAIEIVSDRSLNDVKNIDEVRDLLFNINNGIKELQVSHDRKSGKEILNKVDKVLSITNNSIGIISKITPLISPLSSFINSILD